MAIIYLKYKKINILGKKINNQTLYNLYETKVIYKFNRWKRNWSRCLVDSFFNN